MSITVEILKGDIFYHEHINPACLEYLWLEDEPRKEALESASRVLKGKGSLDELFWITRRR